MPCLLAVTLAACQDSGFVCTDESLPAVEVGRYRLTFDPALVDACRSQLVRVTAPGFRARTMVLAYGARSDNIVDLAGKP
jgi:hypothetical protein